MAISPASAAVTSFAVTNQGMTAYLFNGGAPNPTLTLVRGNTYNFVVNAPGHPFNITTAPGIPVQPFVDPGLTGNGASSGTVVFTVPATGTSSLFYQCGVHTAMTGAINLVATAPAPALGPVGIAILAALILSAGVMAMRFIRGQAAA